MSRVLRAALALLALGALTSARPALAQSDQDNTAHTGWNWLKNQTASQLNSYVSANNARIADLQAANAAGSRFDAVVVSNTGTYQKTWTWFAKMTGNQILSFAGTNNMRPIAVAPYLIKGNLYMGVVFINNTGADAAAWDIYFGSASFVINSITNDGARAIQFKPYGITTSGTSGYVGVGVGNDGRAWAALNQVTPAQIQSQINQGYRVVELMSDYNGSYTALFDNLPVVWYWWYGGSSDTIWGLGTYYSARPISIAPNLKNWNAVYIQN